MAITARDLTAVDGLGLALVAGVDSADREISWAHAIELADPTPYLSGGELVMTTGINIGADDAEQFAYVRRLADAGIAALAVDTGTTLTEVPQGVLDAGDAVGLTVLTVPPETPFIAITRVVIDALRADELRAVQRVVDQQEVLARATLRSGIPGVVDALADCLAATVVVVNVDGTVLAGAGPEQERLTDLLAQSDRPGRRQAASVLADGSAFVTVQTLRAAQPIRGHLAVRTETAMSNSDRVLVAHAVSLVSIAVEKPARVVDAEQLFRAAVTCEILCGSGAVDDAVLRHFGFEPTTEVVVVSCTGAGPVLIAQQRTANALATGSYLLASIGDDIAFLVPATGSRRRIDAVRTVLDPGARGGVSAPVRIADVAVGLEQARIAAQSGAGLRWFGELTGFGVLLDGRSTAELRVLAAPLEPLADDRELIDTLTAFLQHNGHIESAAADLGVHRHTLRNRMRRIMGLLDDDLESADSRTQLWLAVKAEQLAAARRN
ncbi:PucR family transcriptional regulator [Mycolicibacterium sp.]|uniref:PucR family transcriptional regulator n=1 Tax=Mycolicibacterium sp. TaxID=2320850 RepID=UPI003D12D119